MTMTLDVSMLCYVTLCAAAAWALLRAGFIDSSYLPKGKERER